MSQTTASRPEATEPARAGAASGPAAGCGAVACTGLVFAAPLIVYLSCSTPTRSRSTSR